MISTIAWVVETAASLVSKLDLHALHARLKSVVFLHEIFVFDEVLGDDFLGVAGLPILDHALQVTLGLADFHVHPHLVAIEVADHAVDGTVHLALEFLGGLLHRRRWFIAHDYINGSCPVA